MDNEKTEAKFEQLKGKLKETWGKLTDNNNGINKLHGQFSGKRLKCRTHQMSIFQLLGVA